MSKNCTIPCYRALYRLFLIVALFVFGCGSEKELTPSDLETSIDLNTTVGAMTRIFQFNAVPVRGFGVVAGLNGTGSAECPPALRKELEKYIRQQLPKIKDLNPRQFLDNPDTAVVEIEGVIPPLSWKGETFDVKVTPLSKTQTTSLDGGALYTAPLKERSIFMRYDQYSKNLAIADGQLFRNTLDNDSSWYLLGGGTVQEEVEVSLALHQPNYLMANAIRNRINERFGPKVANAISSAEVQITIPPRYRHQKNHFLRIIQLLFLSDDESMQKLHIDQLIQELASHENKLVAECGLEGIGKSALDSISSLLSSESEDVRFRAARCMANIGDERPIPILSAFCKDPQSSFCIPALQAVGHALNRRKAEPILLTALENDNLDIRLTAYNQLLNIKSFSITRSFVANSFLVERIYCGGPKLIYISRKDVPKIVLFGSPINSAEDVFVQSYDGMISINGRPGDKYLAVSRRNPNRPRVIGPINSARELSALIRILGESADTNDTPDIRPGLSIPYQDIMVLLKKMVDGGSVQADFHAGSLTNAGALLENSLENDR